MLLFDFVSAYVEQVCILKRCLNTQTRVETGHEQQLPV